MSHLNLKKKCNDITRICAQVLKRSLPCIQMMKRF